MNWTTALFGLAGLGSQNQRFASASDFIGTIANMGVLRNPLSSTSPLLTARAAGLGLGGGYYNLPLFTPPFFPGGSTLNSATGSIDYPDINIASQLANLNRARLLGGGLNGSLDTNLLGSTALGMGPLSGSASWIADVLAGAGVRSPLGLSQQLNPTLALLQQQQLANPALALMQQQQQLLRNPLSGNASWINDVLAGAGVRPPLSQQLLNPALALLQQQQQLANPALAVLQQRQQISLPALEASEEQAAVQNFTSISVLDGEAGLSAKDLALDIQKMIEIGKIKSPLQLFIKGTIEGEDYGFDRLMPPDPMLVATPQAAAQYIMRLMTGNPNSTVVPADVNDNPFRVLYSLNKGLAAQGLSLATLPIATLRTLLQNGIEKGLALATGTPGTVIPGSIRGMPTGVVTADQTFIAFRFATVSGGKRYVSQTDIVKWIRDPVLGIGRDIGSWNDIEAFLRKNNMVSPASDPKQMLYFQHLRAANPGASLSSMLALYLIKRQNRDGKTFVSGSIPINPHVNGQMGSETQYAGGAEEVLNSLEFGGLFYTGAAACKTCAPIIIPPKPGSATLPDAVVQQQAAQQPAAVPPQPQQPVAPVPPKEPEKTKEPEKEKVPEKRTEPIKESFTFRIHGDPYVETNWDGTRSNNDKGDIDFKKATSISFADGSRMIVQTVSAGQTNSGNDLTFSSKLIYISASGEVVYANKIAQNRFERVKKKKGGSYIREGKDADGALDVVKRYKSVREFLADNNNDASLLEVYNEVKQDKNGWSDASGKISGPMKEGSSAKKIELGKTAESLVADLVDNDASDGKVKFVIDGKTFSIDEHLSEIVVEVKDMVVGERVVETPKSENAATKNAAEEDSAGESSGTPSDTNESAPVDGAQTTSQPDTTSVPADDTQTTSQADTSVAQETRFDVNLFKNLDTNKDKKVTADEIIEHAVQDRYVTLLRQKMKMDIYKKFAEKYGLKVAFEDIAKLDGDPESISQEDLRKYVGSGIQYKIS